MTHTEDGRPCVDLRGKGPRDIMVAVSAFLDALADDDLRTFAGELILANRSCEDIAARLALRRIELVNNKVARLASLVQILEGLQQQGE